MREHLTAETIHRYYQGTLAPESIPSLFAHCDACDSCRTRLAREARERTEAAAVHLTEQETVDFATGKVCEGWSVEHLRNCALCAAAVQDLIAFGTGLRRDESRKGRSWLHAAAAVVLLAAGMGGGFLAQRNRPAPNTPLPVLLVDSGGPVNAQSDLPEKELVQKVLRERRLPFPAAAAPAAVATERGAREAAAITLTAPIGVRVASDSPRFRWTGCAGGSYRVELFDEDFNPLARSPQLTVPEWQATTPLPRGRKYLWQVEARCGGRTWTAPAPPEPQAGFEVVNGAVAQRIAGAGASHAALAVIYAQEGLREEAAGELDALDRLNPGSALTASLRSSLPPRTQQK